MLRSGHSAGADSSRRKRWRGVGAMGWAETTTVFLIAAAVFVWANLTARRPVDINRPRLAPLMPLMALSLVVALLMLAHMITLATGHPFQGGARF
ncbi:hypothetical protein CCP1ISM_6010001 [Azospirillaceae bacterium]